jgi:predicted TIM-barrel fold metal-dependent hydrolase
MSQSFTRPTFAAIRPEWLALRQEAVLEPDLPIVDPHHHLWDVDHPRYLLDEALADFGSGHRIEATVFVACDMMYRTDGPEALRPVGETEFVNGIAAMSASGRYGPCRVAAGIVGYADLRLGDAVQPVLEAQLRAGGGRFCGIRQMTVWDADRVVHDPARDTKPGMMADAAFRCGFARLAPLGLSFDAWLYQPQIDEVAELARAFPQTMIVLNHLGGPLRIGGYAARQEDAFAAWKQSLQALAGCPNVVVKLGGLGMRFGDFGFAEQPLPPRSGDLASAWYPFIITAIEVFGASRCMFESNFPVDKSSCAYPVLWNAFKRLAAGASDTEKEALFSGTARRIYQLGAAGRE